LIATGIYKINDKYQIGAQYRLNFNDEERTKWRVVVGGSAKLPHDTTIKAKVDQNLKGTLIAQFKPTKNLTANVSLQGRAWKKRGEKTSELCQKLHLPLNLGLQLEWNNI